MIKNVILLLLTIPVSTVCMEGGRERGIDGDGRHVIFDTSELELDALEYNSSDNDFHPIQRRLVNSPAHNEPAVSPSIEFTRSRSCQHMTESPINSDRSRSH